MAGDLSDGEITNLDSGVSEAGMEAITSKMDEVFSKANADDSAEILGTVKTESSAPSPQEVNRRQNVKKEQQEELAEEGLIDPNNPEGNAPAQDETNEKQEGTQPEAQEQPAAEQPVLDPTLRYVAEELGWKSEDIDAFHKANPEVAQKTFERMADGYANLSRQFMALGGSPVAPGTPPQPQLAAQPEASTSPLDKLLASDALAKFAETNGQEIVDSFLKPFAQERQALQSEVRDLKAYVEVQQRRAVAQEATTVIDRLAGQYGDVYGKDSLRLDQSHQQARSNLAQVADQLRAGAKAQGREMSVSDALNRAHLLLTSDKRVADGRKQVQEQVQTRNKQLTARPTQRAAKLTAAKSDDAALQAVSRFWADKGIDE